VRACVVCVCVCVREASVPCGTTERARGRMRLTEEDEGADTSIRVHDEPGGDRKAMRNAWLDSFVEQRLTHPRSDPRQTR
jgi:hypothetical protein